jgi:ATP phosphoribosyltransferase regulatory subunit HisZ
MPQFKVLVTELVKERRSYQLEAADAAEAALKVFDIWIDKGIEPEEGCTIEVIDRDYTVADGINDSKIIAFYDSDEDIPGVRPDVNA